MCVRSPDVRLTHTEMKYCFNRGLDFTPPATEAQLREDTPVVVVLHGLTGGECCPCALNLP